MCVGSRTSHPEIFLRCTTVHRPFHPPSVARALPGKGGGAGVGSLPDLVSFSSPRMGSPCAQGCIRREGTAETAPEAVRQAVGRVCQSGWGRLLSVTNAIEAGTWRHGDSGWAEAGRPGGGGGPPPFPMHPCLCPWMPLCLPPSPPPHPLPCPSASGQLVLDMSKTAPMPDKLASSLTYLRPRSITSPGTLSPVSTRGLSSSHSYSAGAAARIAKSLSQSLPSRRSSWRSSKSSRSLLRGGTGPFAHSEGQRDGEGGDDWVLVTSGLRTPGLSVTPVHAHSHVQSGLRMPLLCTVRGGGGGVGMAKIWHNTIVPSFAMAFQDQFYTYVGEIFSVKKIFRAKICVPAPLVATSILTQNKGPGTEAHFWNPPLPPPSPGAHAIPPPGKAIFGPP